MDTNEFPQCGEEVTEETEKRTDCGCGISCEKQNEGGDWYEKMYGFYKKLPKILAIVIAVLFFIWSIVDVSVFVNGSYYGVMLLPSPLLGMLIWWLIGALISYCSYLISSIVISPTVLRTDAVIEWQMANKAENKKGEINETADKSAN